MEKSITTAMFLIASIIAALALTNAVLPAMGKSAGALVTANKSAAERIRTDIAIVHATGDATSDQVTVWVKNIGTQSIKPINASDLFLTTPTSVLRLPYVSGCSSASSPCWDYSIEGSSTDWIQAVTVKFTIETSMDTGNYNISVAVVNAVEADKDFSV